MAEPIDFKVAAGDTLLIDSDDDFVRRWRHSPDFILVSGVEDSAPVAHHRAGIALVIFFGVILGMSISSFGEVIDSLERMTGASLAGFNPTLAALAGAVLMILCGCVRATDGHRSIQLSVILLVGAALGISEALQSSGAATWLAQGLLAMCRNSSPMVVLAVIYVLTVILSEFLSNNATAAMMASLALATAAQLNLDPRPFLIAVAIASSCAFATPIGYQTNLMVYGPGGYRYMDYVRFGVPLSLLVGIVKGT